MVKKSEAQTRAVVDFLMYLTSPYAAKTLVEEAVKARQPINGPLLIPGANLPEQISRRFSAFEHRGFEKLSFRGLADEQESVWKWTVWAQRYLDGRISVDQCLDRYAAILRAQKLWKYSQHEKVGLRIHQAGGESLAERGPVVAVARAQGGARTCPASLSSLSIEESP